MDIEIDDLVDQVCGVTLTNRHDEIRDRIANDDGGNTAIHCQSGIVDIVTNDWVIEVSPAAEWMNALGRVLVYGYYFSFHKDRIHLYDFPKDLDMTFIWTRCTELGVNVTFE